MNAFAEKCDQMLVFLSSHEKLDWDAFYSETNLRRDSPLLKYLCYVKAYMDCDDNGVKLTKAGKDFIANSSFVSDRDKVRNSTIVSVLTNGEKKVMQLIADGKLYKEASDELDISINTVKKHLKNVYKKLQVSSKKEACLKFIETQSA